MIDFGIPLKPSQGLACGEYEHRFRGLYVLGKTRTGKSSFLTNLAKNEFDHPLIVLDPAGGLAESIAALAPKDRLTYVTKNNPLCVNPLSRGNLSRSEIANEFSQAVDACVSSVTTSPETSTLMQRLICEVIYVLDQDQMNVKYVSDFLEYKAVRDTHDWHGDKPDFWVSFDLKDRFVWEEKERRDSAKRVSNRLSAFYRDEIVRPFVVGPCEFDVWDIIQNRKIVVFNLYGLDRLATVFLGNLITFAVMSYYEHHAHKGDPPLFLYIDEFHKFLTKFVDFSQYGKYNLSLNIAHQNHEQLSKEMVSNILGNCDTLAVFKCGYAEAERMAKEFQIKPEDFLNLKEYQCWIKIIDSNHLIQTFAPPEVSKFEPELRSPKPGEPYYLKEDCWFGA